MEEELMKKSIKLTEKPVDYSNIISVMKNNRDAKKLIKLYQQMASDKEMAERLYDKLLEYSNDNVRRIAAAHCLKLNIHIEKSEQVLEEIIKSEDDKITKMEAERVLEYWKESRL